MNLEEARNNIGAEVELDESTKPYTCTLRTKGYYEHGYGHIEQKLQGVLTLQKIDHDGDALIECENGARENIHPRHLKLKPQSYKIHVPTEEESREAQELFFELGYVWSGGSNTVKYSNEPYLYAFKNKTIKRDHARYEKEFNKFDAKQITLQNLRDMVAKKKGIKSIGVDLASGDDKTLRVTEELQEFEPHKEMTWEDALRAVADGRKVEFYNELCEQWWDISHLSATEVVRIEKFRIAPQRIYLNGNFTKEELLQKIGEME